jgi:hypothetical protein
MAQLNQFLVTISTIRKENQNENENENENENASQKKVLQCQKVMTCTKNSKFGEKPDHFLFLRSFHLYF